jgi:hypothetical protein
MSALERFLEGRLLAGCCLTSYYNQRLVYDISRWLHERNSNYTQYWKNFVRETDSNLKM